MNLIFDPGLILYLPMHECDGASFASRDAYGHLCTVTGAIWRPDGMYFDGVDDYVSTPDHVAFNVGSQLTVLVWAKNSSSASEALASHYDSGAGQRAWYISDVASNKVSIVISDDGSYNAGHRKDYTSSLQTSGTGFALRAFTFDEGTLKIYVDGVLDTNPTKTQDDAITTIHNSTADVAIGCFLNNGNPGGLFADGTIGEVLVYNCALTPQEIQRKYLATKWRYQ